MTAVVTTSQSKNVAVVTWPKVTKLQPIRHGTGIVLPKELLAFYDIVNPDFYEVECYIVQGGFYLALKRKEAFA